MKKFNLILLCVFFVNTIFSQSLSNIVEKEILIYSDTIVLDSLSIVPGSLQLFCKNEPLPDNLYHTDFQKATISFKDTASLSKDSTYKIKYRVFPINFSKSYFHKDINLLVDSINKNNNKRYSPIDDEETFFSSSRLSKSGSISRGINFGNNQDASVSSDFNLQLSGKINPEISVKANISDSNIPVQADGTSQNLREFDKVFIELSSEKSKLVVGDFEMNKPTGYFMNYHKKVQGAGFSTVFNTKNDNVIETSANATISKGKYNRQKIQVLEGNQGPYKLQGANNETYVIILSGSEKIYINGELMQRGSENDYIINYNSAELSFTAKRPITKDSRIIAEFEYSEMSYARFIIGSQTDFTGKNSNFYLNFFSEKDAKNQNIRQELSDEQKLLFYEIGDNILEAVVYNISEIDTFNREEVLYKKTDTVINNIFYKNIYVYSNDSLQAKYRIGFSYRGENNGNYIQIQTGANGRVYKWISPDNGILQGNYEPVKVLVSPKKKQMITAGGNFKLKNTNINFETALSNNDKNTFSDIDADDNIGYAFKLGVRKNLLKKDTSKAILNLETNYLFTHKNFSAIEQYRNQEFERDWNLQNVQNNDNEQNFNASLKFQKKKLGKITFYTGILNRENNYFGNINKVFAKLQKKKVSFFADVNRLTSKDTLNKTEFLRYDIKIEKTGEKLITGIRNSGEKNTFNFITNDSLSNASYRFNKPEIYIKSSEKLNIPFLISYANREDFLPVKNKLRFSSNSHDYKFTGTFIDSKFQKLKTSIVYRTLYYSDTSISKNKNEKTLTGRVEYNIRLFKGAFSNRIFLEHVSGNEIVKEFSYIQVQTGQGLFTWEDFNSNNIKELNEFVKANFQDEANYIRISLPTNEYKHVYNQNFNYLLNLNPKRIWFNEKGVKNLLSAFSNKFSYKLNRKINEKANYFEIQTADRSLLSLNSMLNNNLLLNIKPTKTSLNFIFISNKSKILLVNGIDTRKNEFINILFNQRFNSFILSNKYKTGNKTYKSEFFPESDYDIKYFENKSSLTYKIDDKTELIANFILKHKRNISGEENMTSYNFGAEYKVTNINQGNVMLKFDYIKINYIGNSNTSISYEILEGLKTGKNYFWSILWYKKITKYLQLELNYSGRKSEENKVIHSGGVSVRAIF